MIIHEVAQRSPEWFALRLGRLTGSCAADIMATIKSGEAAARRNLRVRLALERITGKGEQGGYESADMILGREREAEALALYRQLTGRAVKPVGFISHDTLMAGCSPDGCTADGGIVEAKCPKPATHLAYLKTQEIPWEYKWQCLHNLWISEAPWCDFLSYNPEFPEGLRHLVRRMVALDVDSTGYPLNAMKFLLEVDDEVKMIRDLAAPVF